MKRYVVALAAVLVTGCAPSPHLPEKLPPADDPVAWAGRLCAALGPLSGVRNVRPTLNPDDPAMSRNSLSTYFNDTQSRIGESLGGMDQVGPSPIPGGDDVATKIRGALERLQRAFAAARTQVDAVDPTDPQELNTKLPDILNGLATASADPELTDLNGNAALNAAVQQSPSCAILNTGKPVTGTG
jgi:hypothetical protein